MIKVENLHKRFKRLQALNNINVEFSKGQVVSLIGPNGSGKTTLIKCLLGLVQPDNGQILFNGISVSKDIKYRRHIGYMPQIGRYPDNTKIGQVFNTLRSLRGKDTKVDEELFYRFKLDAMRDKAMKALSGGTRQKASAALAFLFDADVLILDEPTAGLDPVASEILKEKIIVEKAKGKLILITSHILSDLEELTTNVLYLQDGKIVFNKSMPELYEMTGEAKLSKAIASVMKAEANEKELTYLRMAK